MTREDLAEIRAQLLSAVQRYLSRAGGCLRLDEDRFHRGLLPKAVETRIVWTWAVTSSLHPRQKHCDFGRANLREVVLHIHHLAGEGVEDQIQSDTMNLYTRPCCRPFLEGGMALPLRIEGWIVVEEVREYDLHARTYYMPVLVDVGRIHPP